MTPDTPPRKTTTVTFDSLFDLAMTASIAYKKTYAHALDLGISPMEIVRYALCDMRPDERDAFQSRLAQCPWALGRVAAIVKARRRTLFLGTELYEELCSLADSEHPDPHSAGSEILDRLGV